MSRLAITLDLATFDHDADVVDILTRHTERLRSLGVNHARPGETVELFTILTPDGTPVGSFRVTG